MKCTKCGIAMKEMKRVFHKQRKWVCPKCGKIKFQKIRKKQ